MTTKKPLKPITLWRNSLADACGINQDGTKLRPIVVAMLHTMSVRADNDTLEFFITSDEIQERLGLQPRVVTKLLIEAMNSGWIKRTKVGHNGSASRYVLTFGRSNNPSGEKPDHYPTAKVGSTGVQVIGSTGVQVEVAQPCTRTTPELAPGNTPLETRSPATPSTALETRSTRASNANQSGVENKPQPIPADWKMNGQHSAEGTKHDVWVKPIAGHFKRWARGEAVKRSNWDTCFMALLRLEIANIDPDEKGFSNWSDYSQAAAAADVLDCFNDSEDEPPF